MGISSDTMATIIATIILITWAAMVLAAVGQRFGFGSHAFLAVLAFYAVIAIVAVAADRLCSNGLPGWVTVVGSLLWFSPLIMALVFGVIRITSRIFSAIFI
jgi:hypothetical protein